MANYYRVSPKFWLWARRRGLTDAQTSLAFYLLTCEHRNLEGLYRLPKPYIAADLAWPTKKVDETLAAIVETGFALYDEDAYMVLIPKALKHQAPTTEKQITGAVNQLERIPRTSLWDAFRMACESHCPRLADAIEERWPCDSNTRAGAISSSNSSSKPPQPPEQARGEQAIPGQASPVRANPRARGTNPRAVAAAAASNEAAVRSEAAAGLLEEPSDKHRRTWERMRAVMQQAVGDGSSWALYVEPLELAGVADGVLVLDGPDMAWRWHSLPRLIEACAATEAVRARLATGDEHRGRALETAA